MEFTIKAKKRENLGKNASRRLRKQGVLPVILYGLHTPPVPLVVEKKDIFKILRSETGENTIFKVSFDSDTKNVMLKEIQRDPVTDEILHADLIQIAMDKTIQVSVPIILKGEAVGVKTEGGFIDFITREVEVECLPKNIPDNIEVDISSLHLNQALKIEDIVLPEGVKIITDVNTVVAMVAVPSVEEVEVEAKEEEEIIGEEEEPEVIKKEKAEKEEKEEAEEKE